jgi:hypothetical protein
VPDAPWGYGKACVGHASFAQPCIADAGLFALFIVRASTLFSFYSAAQLYLSLHPNN